MNRHPYHTRSIPRPSYSRGFLAATGIGAFVVGGLATIGAMQLPTILRGGPEPVLLAVDTGVTRAPAPELLAVPATDVAAVEPAILPEAEVATPEVSAASLVVETESLPELTPEQALAEKQAKIAEAIEIANRNKMRMLTEGVLAGLYDVTVEDAETGTRIALNSRNASSAVDDLQQILLDASRSGAIEVPQELASDSGEVDAQTLLFDLVQRSLAQGTEEEAAAAQEMSARAFAASQAQTETVQGKRYYTVERGDSLAYIALQFYGSTNSFGAIFEANRDILTSPDEIKVGQRLVIPNA